MLIQEIKKWCLAEGLSLSVTASTGIAGLHIGGSSLHDWAGINLGAPPAEKLVEAILIREMKARNAAWAEETALERDIRLEQEHAGYRFYYYEAYQRWMCTDILIIDESMYSQIANFMDENKFSNANDDAVSMISGNLFDKLVRSARN